MRRLLEEKDHNRRQMPMKQLIFLTRVLLTLPLIGLGLPLEAGVVADRPNMLLIICDDLNDSVGGMGGHPQAKTPNIDRLMARGVRFVNAQANAPLCGPSRASLWSGLAPQTTGYYGYDQQKNHWRKNPVLKDSVTLFELAAARGYLIQATGKIHHNGHEDWSIFKNADGTEGFGVQPSFGPYPWDGSQNKKQWGCLHPDLPKCWHDENVSWDSGFGPIRDISKEFGGKGSWILNRGKPYRYVSADDRDLMPDEQSAEYAVGVLKKKPWQALPVGGRLQPPALAHVCAGKLFQALPARLHPVDSPHGRGCGRLCPLPCGTAGSRNPGVWI
jgi:hypothetical protein